MRLTPRYVTQKLRDGGHAVLDRQRMVYVRMGMTHEQAQIKVAALNDAEMKARTK